MPPEAAASELEEAKQARASVRSSTSWEAGAINVCLLSAVRAGEPPEERWGRGLSLQLRGTRRSTGTPPRLGVGGRESLKSQNHCLSRPQNTKLKARESGLISKSKMRKLDVSHFTSQIFLPTVFRSIQRLHDSPQSCKKARRDTCRGPGRHASLSRSEF